MSSHSLSCDDQPSCVARGQLQTAYQGQASCKTYVLDEDVVEPRLVQLSQPAGHLTSVACSGVDGGGVGKGIRAKPKQNSRHTCAHKCHFADKRRLSPTRVKVLAHNVQDSRLEGLHGEG